MALQLLGCVCVCVCQVACVYVCVKCSTFILLCSLLKIVHNAQKPFLIRLKHYYSTNVFFKFSVFHS